jgi:transposase
VPHLVEFDHDSTAFRLGFLGVHFREALDPGLHARRRHAQQLGGAVHRQPADVEQHGRHLHPQRHAARRRVGEVQPAGLAAVALLAAHEPVLDVLLAPATFAPQPHSLTPCTVPPSAHIGNLCCPETIEVHTRFSRWAKGGVWKRVFEHLAGDADNEYAMIDSTIVRAHQHSAGAAKKAAAPARRSGAAAAA